MIPLPTFFDLPFVKNIIVQPELTELYKAYRCCIYFCIDDKTAGKIKIQ